jgi:IclR family transcriptional regulator, acetate operon repressor
MARSVPESVRRSASSGAAARTVAAESRDGPAGSSAERSRLPGMVDAADGPTSSAAVGRLNRSVERALRTLRHIGASEQPLSLAALARTVGVPKSSLLSLLRALEGQGFIENRDGGYILGLSVFELGCAYARAASSVRVVHPVLIALSRRLDMAAHFAVRDGDEVVYLEKEEPPGLPIRLASFVGGRLPLHLTAVGQAILAPSGPAALEELSLEPKGTSGFPRSPAELAETLKGVTRRGYAVDEGETLKPVRCVAAVVRDSAGKVSGAIGVSYLRHGGPSPRTVGPVVKDAAAQVSHRLGFDPRQPETENKEGDTRRAD